MDGYPAHRLYSLRAHTRDIPGTLVGWVPHALWLPAAMPLAWRFLREIRDTVLGLLRVFLRSAAECGQKSRTVYERRNAGAGLQHLSRTHTHAQTRIHSLSHNLPHSQLHAHTHTHVDKKGSNQKCEIFALQVLRTASSLL